MPPAFSRSSLLSGRVALVATILVVLVSVAGISLLSRGGSSDGVSTSAAAVSPDRGAGWTARQRSDAKRARAQSRRRYAGLSKREAFNLARRTFPAQTAAPLFSGNGGGGNRVIANVSDDKAVVKDIAGKKLLLVASHPLVANDEKGKPAPVDLSLERGPGGISPQNSRVPFVVDPNSPAKVAFSGFGLGMKVAHAQDGMDHPGFDGDLVIRFCLLKKSRN